MAIAGKDIGEVKGTFKISNTPVFSQMTLGILTEKGIFMASAPSITN